MAERRMFTKKITDDDNFLNLSSSAQALYLHLSMSADDDGFCNQVTASIFKAHASIQDLQALLENRYIYQFENGVIVIKHWRLANALRKDRYTPTIYKNEMAMLGIDEHGAYTKNINDGCQMVATWLPQDRLGKDRLDKDSINIDMNPPLPPIEGEESVKRFKPPTLEEVKAYCEERMNGIDPEEFIDYYESKGWMIGKNKMKSWQAAVRTFERTRRKKGGAIDWSSL